MSRQLQLWRRAPESDNLYLADQVGYVRKGDYVAVMLVLESWRQQFKRPFRVAVDPKHPGTAFAHWFADYLIPVDKFEDWFPPLGCIWSHADFAHRRFGITPELSNLPPAQDHITIIPVLDAKYDCDKNWSLATTKRLIDAALGTGRRVLVAGNKPTLTPVRAIYGKAERLEYVEGSIVASATAVLSAACVIGGDTGLTHLAAVSQQAQLVISVQGCYAYRRALGTYQSWRPWLQRNFFPWTGADRPRWCLPKFSKGKEGVVVLSDMCKHLRSDQWEVVSECLKSISV